MHGQSMIDVLLVEDHPVMRLGLMTAIGAAADLTAVAEVGTATEAMLAARRLRPAVVVMPLRLGGTFAGIELCRDLKSGTSSPQVLVYSSFNSAPHTSAAYLSGADSFVYKGESSDQLVASVRATARGQRIWLVAHPDTADSWMDNPARTAGLTPREREILGLILRRATNAEICHELHIELTTVKTHVRNILRKLGLTTRRELYTSSATAQQFLPQG